MTHPETDRDTLAVILGVASLSIAVLTLLGVGIIVVFTAFTLLTDNTISIQSTWTLIVLLLSLSGLSLPGAYLGLKHRQSTAIQARAVSPVQMAALLIIFGLVLVIGEWMLRTQGVFLWASPLMHILAAGIPVLFAALFVLDRGEPISKIRAWGSFISGLWLAPLVALILEIALAIPLLIVLFVGFSDTVNTPLLLEALAQSPGNPETLLLEHLNTLLDQPLVVGGILGYLSVAVPIIEEIAKSLGTWFLIRRKLTPSLAFIGGTLSGAAYGLFEAFFLAQPGEGWLTLMIARAGATLMHMFTAGLTGLGIYYGVRERKRGRAVLLYAAAILLHGIWNFAALGIGLEDLAQVVQNPIVEPGLTSVIALASSGFLVAMTSGAAFGLWKIPRMLRLDQGESEGVVTDPA